jgi:hypothetical protein
MWLTFCRSTYTIASSIIVMSAALDCRLAQAMWTWFEPFRLLHPAFDRLLRAHTRCNYDSHPANLTLDDVMGMLARHVLGIDENSDSLQIAGNVVHTVDPPDRWQAGPMCGSRSKPAFNHP